MIRRLLPVLLLFGLAGAFIPWSEEAVHHAIAQSQVFCPTRPPGTDDNTCASTAFVQAAGGGSGGITVGTTTVTGGTSGQCLYNNSGVVGTTSCTGGGGITFTDGTHTVTGSTQLTVTGGTVGGSTPNATLTVSGGTITQGSTATSGFTNNNVLTSSSSTVGQVSPTVTVNGTPCTLGSSCSPSGTGGITNVSMSQQNTTGTVAGTTALTLVAAKDFINSEGIRVNHAGAAFTIAQPTGAAVTHGGTTGSTSYAYTIASLDSAGGVGKSVTNATTTTGNATLSAANYNIISWTAASGASGYAVYGNKAGSLTFLGITLSTNWHDIGGAAEVAPDWLPAAPQTSASLPDFLVTTVSSGGGTTSIVMANAATQSGSGLYVTHDDTAAIQAAFNATPPASVTFPASTQCAFITSQLELPDASPIEVRGTGRTTSCIQAAALMSAMIDKGTNMATFGGSVHDLGLLGAGLASINLEAQGGWNYQFYNLNLFDVVSNANLYLGNGTQYVGNFLVRDVFAFNGPAGANDNCNSPSCLPFANGYNDSINNNFINFIGANATFANYQDDTIASSNHLTAVHGYNYPVALIGTYNMYLGGSGTSSVGFEGDGAVTADVGILGSENVITGSTVIFDSVTPTIGFVLLSGAIQNIIHSNMISGPTTANGVVNNSGGATNSACDNLLVNVHTGLATYTNLCN